MTSKEWLQKRKTELLNRLRDLDPEAVIELEGVLRSIDLFDPAKVSAGEFAGLDNLTAAEKYLRKAGRSTLDQMAEAIWEGGMRPPENAGIDGTQLSEDQAKAWVKHRFKQAISRHITYHKGRDRLKLEQGYITLNTSKK